MMESLSNPIAVTNIETISTEVENTTTPIAIRSSPQVGEEEQLLVQQQQQQCMNISQRFNHWCRHRHSHNSSNNGNDTTTSTTSFNEDNDKTIQQMLQIYWIPLIRRPQQQTTNRTDVLKWRKTKLRALLSSHILQIPHDTVMKYYQPPHNPITVTTTTTNIQTNEPNNNATTTTESMMINEMIEYIDDDKNNDKNQSSNNDTATGNENTTIQQQQQYDAMQCRLQIQLQILLRWIMILEWYNDDNDDDDTNTTTNATATTTTKTDLKQVPNWVYEYDNYYNQKSSKKKTKKQNKKLKKTTATTTTSSASNQTKHSRQTTKKTIAPPTRPLPWILQHIIDYIQLLALHFVTPQDGSLYQYLQAHLFLPISTITNNNSLPSFTTTPTATLQMQPKRSIDLVFRTGVVPFVQPIWDELELPNPLTPPLSDHPSNNPTDRTNGINPVHKKKKKSKKRSRTAENQDNRNIDKGCCDIQSNMNAIHPSNQQRQQQQLLEQILPDSRGCHRPSTTRPQPKPTNQLIRDTLQSVTNKFRQTQHSRYSNLSTILQQQIPVTTKKKSQQQQQQQISSLPSQRKKTDRIEQATTAMITTKQKKENVLPSSIQATTAMSLSIFPNKPTNPTTKFDQHTNCNITTKSLVAEAMNALQKRQRRHR